MARKPAERPTEVSVEAMIQALSARVEGQQRALKVTRKALDGLAVALEAGAAGERAALGHVERLRGAALEGELGEARDGLAVAVEAHLEGQRRAVRAALMGSLRQLSSEAGVELVRLGDAPPTVLLAPLEVELDFEAGKARLSYARRVVAEVPCEAEAIVEARQRAIDAIRDEALPSEQFFDLLRRAYRLVLTLQGLAEGERVELVDLLMPLSVLREALASWRGVERIRVFPRHLLSYQLQRLRREGMLERDGVRIDLGAATGGSTRNKRDVLFVPTSPTEGQYYLTIRMEAR